IPVTHRGVSTSFAVITGHEDPTKGESSLHLDRLANAAGTLVLLMGVERLEALTAELVRGGRAPETPVALVRWGTWAQQEVVTGTLADIAAKIAGREFEPPAVIIVGEVVALRDRLRWFDNRPLTGKRVLITRSRDQAGRLGQLLAAYGAEPLEVPSIAIAPPDDYGALDGALSNLAAYQWIVFTSVNGVQGFFDRLRTLGRDARALGAVQVCAIGPATADACRSWGVFPDLVPDAFLTEAVASAMIARGIGGARILLPRTDIVGEDLPGMLGKAGATVDQVIAYRTVTAPEIDPEARALLADGKVDLVTFTSSSTVRNLVSLLGADTSLLARTRIASIGPVTTRAAEELGLPVAIKAREHTIAGLVAAIVEDSV
ncbi:MAG: uroporphyrinogen-III synthase, partial [Chloroflexi bacterium]|nr:uroporphyrinogen-III synthase [Chloroflexota bacterium]